MVSHQGYGGEQDNCVLAQLRRVPQHEDWLDRQLLSRVRWERLSGKILPDGD